MAPREILARCWGSIVQVWIELRGEVVLREHERWEHWRWAEWGAIKISLRWGEEQTMWMESEGKWWRGPTTKHKKQCIMIL